MWWRDERWRDAAARVTDPSSARLALTAAAAGAGSRDEVVKAAASPEVVAAFHACGDDGAYAPWAAACMESYDAVVKSLEAGGLLPQVAARRASLAFGAPVVDQRFLRAAGDLSLSDADVAAVADQVLAEELAPFARAGVGKADDFDESDVRRDDAGRFTFKPSVGRDRRTGRRRLMPAEQESAAEQEEDTGFIVVDGQRFKISERMAVADEDEQQEQPQRRDEGDVGRAVGALADDAAAQRRLVRQRRLARQAAAAQAAGQARKQQVAALDASRASQQAQVAQRSAERRAQLRREAELQRQSSAEGVDQAALQAQVDQQAARQNLRRRSPGEGEPPEPEEISELVASELRAMVGDLRAGMGRYGDSLAGALHLSFEEKGDDGDAPLDLDDVSRQLERLPASGVEPGLGSVGAYIQEMGKKGKSLPKGINWGDASNPFAENISFGSPAMGTQGVGPFWDSEGYLRLNPMVSAPDFNAALADYVEAVEPLSGFSGRVRRALQEGVKTDAVEVGYDADKVRRWMVGAVDTVALAGDDAVAEVLGQFSEGVYDKTHYVPLVVSAAANDLGTMQYKDQHTGDAVVLFPPDSHTSASDAQTADLQVVYVPVREFFGRNELLSQMAAQSGRVTQNYANPKSDYPGVPMSVVIPHVSVKGAVEYVAATMIVHGAQMKRDANGRRYVVPMVLPFDPHHQVSPLGDEQEDSGSIYRPDLEQAPADSRFGVEMWLTPYLRSLLDVGQVRGVEVRNNPKQLIDRMYPLQKSDDFDEASVRRDDDGRFTFKPSVDRAAGPDDELARRRRENYRRRLARAARSQQAAQAAQAARAARTAQADAQRVREQEAVRQERGRRLQAVAGGAPQEQQQRRAAGAAAAAAVLRQDRQAQRASLRAGLRERLRERLAAGQKASDKVKAAIDDAVAPPDGGKPYVPPNANGSVVYTDALAKRVDDVDVGRFFGATWPQFEQMALEGLRTGRVPVVTLLDMGDGPWGDFAASLADDEETVEAEFLGEAYRGLPGGRVMDLLELPDVALAPDPTRMTEPLVRGALDGMVMMGQVPGAAPGPGPTIGLLQAPRDGGDPVVVVGRDPEDAATGFGGDRMLSASAREFREFADAVEEGMTGGGLEQLVFLFEGSGQPDDPLVFVAAVEAGEAGL